jgi:methylglutaconyl-CoA hydratase
MQQMVHYSEAENTADALILANLLHTLHTCPKPTIAMVQGSAYGGGAGLVAACDIAIAANNARFCFSEVKLGLIPAVISPYVIKAIGERAAKWLFMSAEMIDAQQAQSLGLVHHCVNESELLTFTEAYANQLTQNAPEAVAAVKYLVDRVAGQAINEALILETSQLIAARRVSAEGQSRLLAFLRK